MVGISWTVIVKRFRPMYSKLYTILEVLSKNKNTNRCSNYVNTLYVKANALIIKICTFKTIKQHQSAIIFSTYL